MQVLDIEKLIERFCATITWSRCSLTVYRRVSTSQSILLFLPLCTSLNSRDMISLPFLIGAALSIAVN